LKKCSSFSEQDVPWSAEKGLIKRKEVVGRWFLTEARRFHNKRLLCGQKESEADKEDVRPPRRAKLGVSKSHSIGDTGCLFWFDCHILACFSLVGREHGPRYPSRVLGETKRGTPTEKNGKRCSALKRYPAEASQEEGPEVEQC